MRILVVSIMMLLGASPAPGEIKLRVTLTQADGNSGDYKLDWIDESKVYLLLRGSLEAVTFKRNDVISLSFGEDMSDRFQAGEEGFVLKDGTILPGNFSGMDLETFWIIRKGSNREEKIDRETVAFIQFAKTSVAIKMESVSTEFVLITSKQWEDTGVDVVVGQKIWFTVSGQETFRCGPAAPRVNAAGKEPFVRHEQRPIPEARQCALIARIGKKGPPFLVGLNFSPFIADRKGRLFVEVNDFHFQDNLGKISVYIKTGDTAE